jgi:hypothetical protein
MTLIDRNREPKPIELRLFGVVCAGVFGLLGWLALSRLGSAIAASILWAMGLGWVILYYSVAALRRPMYKAWMTLFYPLGWFISHAMLAIVYFIVLTPLGLLLRLLGRDPLDHRFDRSAASYWLCEPSDMDAKRYFKQF